MADKYKPIQTGGGFTLVELMTVISLIALVAAYMTVRLGHSSNDAKIAMSRAVLAQKVPEAIANFQSYHGGSCTSLSAVSAKNGGGHQASQDDSLIQALVPHGLHPLTPWGEPLEAEYDPQSGVFALKWSMAGVLEPVESAHSLMASLHNHPRVKQVDYDVSDSILRVEYPCE